MNISIMETTGTYVLFFRSDAGCDPAHRPLRCFMPLHAWHNAAETFDVNLLLLGHVVNASLSRGTCSVRRLMLKLRHASRL